MQTEINAYQLKRNLVGWIENCRDKSSQYGRYRFHPSPSFPPLLYASCFAALARELIGDLESLPSYQRTEWIAYLQDHQDPTTGFFKDPLITTDDLRGKPDMSYVNWQLTYFCLHALDALGSTPRYPLAFLENFCNVESLVKWLERLNFKAFWLESNRVMFVASFLYYKWRSSGEHRYIRLVHALLDWLDDRQDPETGYWGTNQGAPLYDAMAGAYHIYMFYYACGRSPNHLEAIIDSTLKLQTRAGGFAPVSGACLDLDAVDILVNTSRLTDYKASDVKSALDRAFYFVLRHRLPNGAFVEATCEGLNVIDWLSIPLGVLRHGDLKTVIFQAKRAIGTCFRKKALEFYSGVQKAVYPRTGGDMWSAWFRPLALALISKRYPGEYLNDIDWHFRKLPGLGYYPEETRFRNTG